MLFSKISSSGQTAIPTAVRRELNAQQGDTLTYELMGDHVIIRLQPRLKSLRGALASRTAGTKVKKGKKAFDAIRKDAPKPRVADLKKQGL